MEKNKHITKIGSILVFSLLILSTIGIASSFSIREENNTQLQPVNNLKSTSTLADSPWPMFRHDLKHTGYTAYTGPATANLLWTFSVINDGIVSSPSIGADGTIYFGAGWLFWGANDTALYALNPDGSLKWRFEAEDGFFSSPAVTSDGIIYASCLDGSLYAIKDMGTYGDLLWKTYLGYIFSISSPAVAPNGQIYIGSPSFNFLSIYPNGTIQWTYHTNWCIISSPAIQDDGTVYIGSKDHNLYAFHDDIEDMVWKAPLGTFYDGHLVDTSPAIGPDGTIYVGTDQYGAWGQTPIPVNTSFWAINPDGTLKWSFDTEDGVESSPAIGPDGIIYFGSYDNYFYAVEDMGDHGELKWKVKTDDAIDGSPTVDGNGHIYFGSRDNKIYALYANGTVKWTYETQDGIECSPTIDDKGNLLIGSFDGNLYCIGTEQPDISVDAITLDDTVIPDLTYQPTATIRNVRDFPSSAQATCTIRVEGTLVYTDTSTISFTGKDTKLLFFDDWIPTEPASTTYDIVVEITSENDDNPWNDQTSKQVESTEGTCVCGDANGDGDVNVGDSVYLINYVFKGGPPPTPYQQGDANGDGSVNIADSVYISNYIFRGGQPPVQGCCG